MEHAGLRLNLSGAFATATPATPKFLAPLAPPTFPFTSPAWTRPRKPRAVALLDVFKSHELLETYTVDQKPVYLIGRNAAACDIVLSHCSVSRLHAAIIHHKDGAAYLVDLGSCHGSFVDDIRLQALQPTLIVHGATIRFGASSRSYAFKSFESREQIIERVQSRIGLAPDEIEVEQNTLLNRALSYRLGFSIPLSHQQADAEGDDPMAAALPPARQREAPAATGTLIRRTQSEDSTATGAFALTLPPPAAARPSAQASALEPGRKRSRAQSAGLPSSNGAAAASTVSPGQPHVLDEDDGMSKRVHFSERPAETIPARPVYFSPELTPSSAASSASSSPQIVPQSELPPRSAPSAKTNAATTKTAASHDVGGGCGGLGLSISVSVGHASEPRRSLSPPPPLRLLGRHGESCSTTTSGAASDQTTPSREVAS